MTTAPDVPSELVVAESHVIEPSAKGARNALETYQQIQKVFDEKMPDAIMKIGDKKFRKKIYWRGVANAFHVELRLLSEERVEISDDWGYLATYRAATNDDRQCDGDGACMASEKWTKRHICPSCQSGEFAFRSKNDDGEEYYCWAKKGGCGNEWTPAKDSPMTIDKSQSTLHNIRSHAHTRAKNRAISDLVGFGEVSADEMPSGSFGDDAPPQRPRPQAEKPVGQRGAGKLASEKQTGMLYAKSLARAKTLGITGTEYESEQALGGSIRKVAMEMLGFFSKEEITAAAVTSLVASIEAAVLDDEGRVVIPEGGI